MPSNRSLCFLFIGAACIGLACQPHAPEPPTPLYTAFQEAELNLLATWYPRVVDNAHGGYLSDFDAAWAPAGDQHKMIVTQARHVWTASQAFMRHPADTMYLAIARHGYTFLRDVMWDDVYGGFFTLATQEGEPLLEGGNRLKTAYGNAFGVYGLAAFARASQDPEALAFAQQAFRWLDDHSHDPEHLGYFQFITRTGEPLKTGFNNIPPKDYNGSIHLLEAFTELYRVWPDERVRTRLEEMLLLVRDTMVYDEKYLQLFFSADWQPLSYRDSSSTAREANYGRDHVSVGHDVETAFLMLEAVHALGLPEEPTARIGKSMVDHALEAGWDTTAGGFYDYVYYLPGETNATVIKDTKTWWSQAEGLNALLLMHTLFPEDAVPYFDRFALLWDYVDTHLIDHENGGWYSGGLDKEPLRAGQAKAHIWKGSYHTVRSIMHCADMLEALQIEN